MRPNPAVLTLTVLLAVAPIACGGAPTPTLEATAPTTSPIEPAVTKSERTQPAPPTEEAMLSTPVAAEPTADNPETPIETGPPLNVIAEVNSIAIPMADFQRQLTDARTYLLSQGLINPDTEEGQAALRALRNQVLDQLIDQLLIVQAAEQLGLTVTDEELEASIAKIKEDLGSDEAFAESLAANNLTEETFRKLQQQQLLSRKVIDAVTAEIPDVAEQVHARHILVRTKEEVESILEELENGADFAELAKEHSVDETSKNNGGDLGFFPRGVVLPEFEEVAFTLDVGERSGAVETSFGYHIIEVLERDKRPIPDEIKEGLRQQMITNWLEAQRAQADIQRYLEP
ncbi:MAG: peptidylprolyl isomerase [Anaerolineae bacterium]